MSEADSGATAWMSKPGGACTSEKHIADIWEKNYGVELIPLYAIPDAAQARIRELEKALEEADLTLCALGCGTGGHTRTIIAAALHERTRHDHPRYP